MFVLIVCFLAYLQLLYECAVPGVVPDLSSVAVDAEHAVGCSALKNFNVVVAVK